MEFSNVSSTEPTVLSQSSSILPEKMTPKSNISSSVASKKNKTSIKSSRTKLKKERQKKPINSKSEKITNNYINEEMETYSLRNKVEQIASSSSSYIEPSDTVDEAAESDDTSPVTPKNKQITKKIRNRKNSKIKIKRYCTCHEVAYGLMVACDNKTCPYKWFHFECVGITQRPIDDWYCNPCIKKMKK
uniref:Inhibitor of growth protein 3 n=1 Tax=Sipha flava TaxID=143950 RepID=A0A2S2QFF9_9HEMI